MADKKIYWHFAGVLLFQVIESGIDESDERLSGLL